MFNWIEIIKLLLIIIACILLYKLIKSPKILLGDYAKDKIEERLKKVPDGYFNYERLEKYLVKMGHKTTPSQFVLIKIEIGILLMLIIMQYGNILLSLIGLIIGFYIPDIKVKSKNKKDNDSILKDLQRVYDVLRIETKSGVHISDAIRECYLVSSNPRLKEGLLILSNGLSTNKSFEILLQEFNNKFDNPYIDSFCIIIKQSLETGRTVQILEDLSEQIKDIDEAKYLIEEERIEKKGGIIQFVIYVLGMITAFYGLSIRLMESIIKF